MILEILDQTEKKTTFSLSRILLGTFSLEIAISFLFYRNKTSIEKWCYVNVKLKLEIFRQNINFLYRSRSDNKTLLSKNCREFYQQQKMSPTALYCICWYCTKRLESGGEQRKRYTTNLCQENDALPLLLVNTRHIPHKQIWPLTFLIRFLASMPTISSCHPHLNERKEVIYCIT